MKPTDQPVAAEQLPLGLADYLLSHLAQECCEVAIRCTKAQHFGLDEVQPEQSLTNRERLNDEVHDVLAMVEYLQSLGILPETSRQDALRRLSAKLSKAGNFRDYSRKLGRLL